MPSNHDTLTVNTVAYAIDLTSQTKGGIGEMRFKTSAIAAIDTLIGLGWSPPLPVDAPEPLTEEEQAYVFAMASSSWIGALDPMQMVSSIVNAAIAALPDRFGVRIAAISRDDPHAS